MQTSMVRFAIICFRLEIPFLGNFVQKVKIIRLNWNSIPRLIWTCRIQWHGLLNLFFRTGNTLFGQIFQKREIFSLIWNLVLKVNSNFGHVWFRNSKLFVQSETPNFRVSKAIWNTIDIPVKSRHFPERRDVRRQYF